MQRMKVKLCPICGTNKIDYRDSFWACKNCGYETAGISDRDLHNYYNREDLGLKVQNILEEKDYESPLRIYHKKALKLLESYKGKNVCDIGCGVGVFLKELQKKGGNVYGYDINKEQANIAKKKYKLHNVSDAESLNAYCKKLGLRKNFFDIITAFEVIEHVPDINNFIEESFQYLRPGGYLIISTPNRDRIYMHERWDYPPIHVSRITRKAAVLLVKKHGFLMKKWISYNELGYYSNNAIHKLTLSQKMLSTVVNSSEKSSTRRKKLGIITKGKKIVCTIIDIPIFLVLSPFHSKGHTMFFVAQKIV